MAKFILVKSKLVKTFSSFINFKIIINHADEKKKVLLNVKLCWTIALEWLWKVFIFIEDSSNNLNGNKLQFQLTT